MKPTKAVPEKVAFYAPMKSPRHPRPSGDRRLARLFIRALRGANFAVELASSMRAWEGGDLRRQRAIQTSGQRAAVKLIRDYQRRSAAARPKFWFTYHLYHKSPDWIGPAVSAALDIPYVVAEASVANKQHNGKWRGGYAQTIAALSVARLIVNLNSNDLAGVRAAIKLNALPANVIQIKPFADISARALTAAEKMRARKRLAARWQLDINRKWLLCVAMMRADCKFESYEMLASALAHMRSGDWQLLIVGDGPARAAVAALFNSQLQSAQSQNRVRMLGRLRAPSVYALMRAADMFVWPARGEAFGMALLEAMGCGLPVVAGASGGVGDIVYHNITGRIVRQPNAQNFAAEIEKLLAAPEVLQRISAASVAAYNQHHQLTHAANIIGAAMRELN